MTTESMTSPPGAARTSHDGCIMSSTLNDDSEDSASANKSQCTATSVELGANAIRWNKKRVNINKGLERNRLIFVVTMGEHI